MKTNPKPLAEKREQLERLRKAWTLRELRCRLVQTKPDELARGDIDRILRLLVAFDPLFDGLVGRSSGWPHYDSLYKRHVPRVELLSTLWRGLLNHWARELAGAHPDQAWDAALRICDEMDLGLQTIEQMAAEAIPEPKVWASEKQSSKDLNP
jgi:hypothetical protein